MIEWEIAKVKPGEQPIVFGTGNAKIEPKIHHAKIGKFDWFQKAGEHGVDVNIVTVKLLDENNHAITQQTKTKEHLFVGKNAKLDKKLNLHVVIDKNQKLSVDVKK